MILTFVRPAMKKTALFLRSEQTAGTRIVSQRFVQSVVATGMSSLLFVSGCMVGPKYTRPTTVPSPPAYKELTQSDYNQTDGWKTAQPKDDALRGKWWEIFGDPQLNALEEQVNISNQTIAAATSNFLVARALVKEARAAYSDDQHQPVDHQFPDIAYGEPVRRRTGVAENLLLDAV